MEKEIFISCDNLTITAKLEKNLYTPLNDFVSNPAVESKYWHSPKNFLYQHNFSFPCGSFLQYGESNNGHHVRLEFNPNKCNWKLVNQIIKRFKYPKITRLDWAVDYKGYDLSDLHFQSLTPRKRIEYKNTKQVLETLYLGSYRSDRFIRIYNKALEKKVKEECQERTYIDEDIEVKDNWWRIESVTRDFEFDKDAEMLTIDENGQVVKKRMKEKITDYFFNPFNFMMYEKKEVFANGDDILKDLKISEKAMIFYLNQNMEELKKLSRPSRKKYENIIYNTFYDLFDFEIHPATIFEKEKDKLTETILEWLKPALDNGYFQTGIAFAN